MAEYEPPQNVGDEVRLMFNAFDSNGDGRISMAELKGLLQLIDPAMWTEEALSKLLFSSDKNNDGELEFTEFWAWICGHGGDLPAVHSALLTEAMDQDYVQWQKGHMMRLEAEKKAQKQMIKVEAEERKLAERESGQRIGKNDYVGGLTSVGVNKGVAASLFAKGDEDGDGEIDRQELNWLNTDNVLTVPQIKELYQKGINGAPGGDQAVMCAALGTFKTWDVDGDGEISGEELVRVIRILNPKLGEATAQKMMQQADTNADGSIDFREFVAWVSGANPKKKKDKEMREARIVAALTQNRADESQEANMQREFEELLHKQLGSRATPAAPCNTLNYGPGAARLCATCKDRHAWQCHGCGFISYFDDCVNGCNFTKTGWTCINGACKKKCGCKRKPEFWVRTGFRGDAQVLQMPLQQMWEAAGIAKPAEGAAADGENAA